MNLTSFKISLQSASCVLLAALIIVASTSSHADKWELIHYGNMAHATSIDPLFFSNADSGWALSGAELLKLSNKGRTWTPILTNYHADRFLNSFTFVTAETGYLVGTQKQGDYYTVLILQTSDGGRTWQERPTNVTQELDRHKAPSLHSVTFCGAKNGWAVGEDLIVHTTDGGQSWQTQKSNVNRDENRLFTVGCASSKVAWAGGTDGLLLRTLDGGNSWTTKDIGTKEILMRIRFFGENGWIVGGTNGRAVLFRIRNGDENWQAQQLPATAGLFDIFFLYNHGWIAAEKGTLLKSDDGGETWSSQKLPTNENLTSLSFSHHIKDGWLEID